VTTGGMVRLARGGAPNVRHDRGRRVALLVWSSCGPTADMVGGAAGGVAGEEGFGRGQLRP
jgi:hypothetical protein